MNPFLAAGQKIVDSYNTLQIFLLGMLVGSLLECYSVCLFLYCSFCLFALIVCFFLFNVVVVVVVVLLFLLPEWNKHTTSYIHTSLSKISSWRSFSSFRSITPVNSNKFILLKSIKIIKALTRFRLGLIIIRKIV